MVGYVPNQGRWLKSGGGCPVAFLAIRFGGMHGTVERADAGKSQIIPFKYVVCQLVITRLIC